MKEYTNLSDPKGRVSGLNPFLYFCSQSSPRAGFFIVQVSCLKVPLQMSNSLLKICHWGNKGCARVLLKCGVSRRTGLRGNQPALSDF